MKLSAVGVTSTNLRKTVKFYEILGFKFPEFKDDEQHVETVPVEGAPKLMIDTEELTTQLIGTKPTPSNHSAFAIECDSPSQVNDIAQKVKEAGFNIKSEPWDAFWGQRYCVVMDPDGYLVDLYCNL